MGIIVLLLCFAVGIALGLLGGGGAVLTVPIFIYLGNLTAHEAIPLSLLIVSVTSFIGCLRYLKKQQVHLKLFLIFSIFGSLGAVAGSQAAPFFSDALLLVLFGFLMSLIGLILLFKIRREASEELTFCQPRFFPSMLLSLSLGVLTGLLGVGGGFMIVPALALLMKCSMHTAIGTSLAVLAVNSAVGFAGHFHHFHVPWEKTISYTAVTAAGVWLGSGLSRRVSPAFLQRGFGVLIIVIGLFLLVKNAPLLKGGAL